VLALPAPAAPVSGAASPARTLVLERIELEGNTRTGLATVLDRIDLRPGEPLRIDRLETAAEDLRRTRLFREVAIHTRPGSAPGRVVAVFRVRENRPHLRLGAGYEDLSGWYLIPLEFNLDNLTGRGEALSLATRFGYRVSGLVLNLRSSSAAAKRSFWMARLRAEEQSRIYFDDGIEINHPVSRGGLDLGFGIPLGRRVLLETTLSFEGVEPDSSATVYRDREILGRSRGAAVPFAELPASIRADLGRRNQTRLALALQGEARRGTGLEARGLRGRIHLEGVLSDEANFVRATVDGRAYLPLGDGLQAAAHLRGGVVSVEAPFYERSYLGGLYTVRGYPSQSLSPPGGDRGMAAASVELRTAWIGPAADPRVTGLLFLDAGWAGGDGAVDLKDTAVGIGYGIRVRVPWVRRIGLDVGVPLSSSPVDESFHLNFGLGWTY